ncbi:MAG: hypothetical protein E7208_09950 [Clostridium butyricum]|nr:hypothetical protein [Clostridium butyricum]
MMMSMLHVINIMEIWVERCLVEAIEGTGVCTCNKCLKDIYALSLNNLKPHYIVSMRGIDSEELDYKFETLKDDIMKQIKISIERIKKNPKHDKDEVENVTNYAEILANEYVRKMIEDSGMCKCDQCRHEVYRIVLNNVKPYYYVTMEGAMITKLESERDQYKTNILLEASKAIDYIKNNCDHERVIE